MFSLPRRSYALRIAFDARSLTSPILRGWDRYTVGLVKALAQQSIEIVLFHRESAPLHPPHVYALDCGTQGLPDRGGLHWEQVAVPNALRTGKFDLYHAPAEHGVPLAAPCPVVLTVHSVTTQSYQRLIKQGLLPGNLNDYLGYERTLYHKWFAWGYSRLQLARASHILTPSDFCRREVIELLNIPPRRVTTTLLAVHDQFNRPPSTLAELKAVLDRLDIKSPYLLYVGGYEPHKNVSGLLKIFAKVNQQRANLSLVLVGSKFYPEELARQARQMGLGSNVVFLVNLTDDLTALYDGAELFVSLSWRETFCLPALEAMTRGVPVVASAWGATPEVVSQGGRLVDPRDHETAAKVILEALASTDRENWSTIARQVAARFQWSTTASDTLKIYHRLAGITRKAA